MFDRRTARQLLLTVLALFLLVAAGTSAFRLSERAGMASLEGEAQHRLDLFAAAIDSIVNRYAHVPGTVPLNPEILAMLRNPDDKMLRQAANVYLERLNTHIDSIAIFVMSPQGVTLAASNWNREDSFVGEDLSFRPYFQAAIQGSPARYYAIGTTRGDPGYFVSHPIRDGRRIIGVAVIKIGLKALEDAWLPSETPAFIADGNGVIILASLPEWRLTALAPLTPERLAEIENTRQYNRQRIGRFPVDLAASGGQQVVTFPPGSMPRGAGEFLALSRRLPDSGWHLTVFSDLRPVKRQAATQATMAVTAMAFVFVVLLLLNQRRRNLRQRLESQALLEKANAELERKVEERTSDLVAANERLRGEVVERERAEQTLRAAQDELVQAAKLAVLGQLATGITHELTQPLGALRTLSENAVEFMRRGDLGTVEKNLGIIGKLVDRMGAIIGPLKSFARKSPARPQAVDIGQAVANALFLLDLRLSRAKVRVANGCQAGSLSAWCDPIRLEQVLVNLVGNAIDAMLEQPERVLTLTMEAAAPGRILIRVADSGSGLPAESMDRIFEPFFTTKPAGVGLGLGLAISRDIVRDFGGELTAGNLAAGGAEFVIDLPARPAKE